MTTIVVSTREAAHREGIIDRYGLDLVVLAQCTIIAARESLERQYAIRRASRAVSGVPSLQAAQAGWQAVDTNGNVIEPEVTLPSRHLTRRFRR
jgi:hypothetical protein